MPRLSSAVYLSLTALAVGLIVMTPAAAFTLQSASTAITFDPADGYAVSALTHRGHDLNFVVPRAAGQQQDRSPWLVSVRLASGQMANLTTANAKTVDQQVSGEKAVVTWHGVSSSACPADLTVTMTVSFDAAGKSHWNLAVAGQAPGALWQVDFPRLAGLRPLGEDALLTPMYLGRLTHNPTEYRGRTVITYPSPMSMQFMALYGTPAHEPAVAGDDGWSRDRSDATGLYWATEDGQCYYKRFGLDTAEVPGQMRLWVENVPPLPQWPLPTGSDLRPVSYKLPYDVVLSAFTGGAFAATGLYREWALKQFWCVRGAAERWPQTTPPAGSKELAQWTPGWFRDAGFWAKFYRDPAKVVPEWAAYEKWLRVPIASHYYRSPIALFDDNYPEMLPTHPYYLSGMRDAKDMNVFPMPYTNGVIWDQDTQSYLKEHGAAAAIKDDKGQIPTWDINGELYAYMCPGTAQWRDKVAETAYKQVAEHGLSGVYLDCLTATGSAACYDATHGHALRGGNYYALGQHQLMQDLRRQVRAVDPGACFFCEECGEWVLDGMDGFLTLDISRAYPLPGQQVFPLFPMVYHDYTINFGGDAGLDYPRDRFAWEMGQMLVWGAVPLHSPAVAKPPQEGDPNAEMLREVVQAYYVAGLPFLQGGAAVDMAVRPMGEAPAQTGSAAHAAISMDVAPCQFTYTLRPTLTRSYQGPAVLASAWRREGNVGVVMVNITDQDQKVNLTLDPARLGLSNEAKLLQTWPREPRLLGAAAGAHELTIPARKVNIVVLTPDAQRVAVGRKLLDEPWQLLTADEGEFKPLQAPGNSLWACSDGPVLNHVAGGATVAEPQWWDGGGVLRPRQGLRPNLPEGAARPREFAQKSFLLLRPLPCRAEGTPAATVFGGDDSFLSARGGGGLKLAFDKPGLAVVTGQDGKLRRAIGTTQRLELAGTDACWVGYARVTTAGLDTLLQSADAASKADLRALQAACEALTAHPSPATLAAASVALDTLERGLQELPAALTPDTALFKLHQQIQTLVTVQLAQRVVVTSAHDWLAPGVPKQVTAFVVGCKAQSAVAPSVVALGSWPRQSLQIGTPSRRPSAEGTSPGFDYELALNAPEYAERMVPVIASMSVKQSGLTFVASDILHLDANRPMELQTQSQPVTALAGRTTTASAMLRNWSPYDLSVVVQVRGPAGWRVAGPAEPVKVPALTNVTINVQATPPTSAARGSMPLEVTTTYAPGGSEMTGLITCHVQPQLVPLVPGDIAWPKPTADALPRLRMRGTVAVYGQPERPINFTLQNVKVSQYTNSTAYRLLDPQMRVVQSGTVPLEKSGTLQVAKPAAGMYFLELDSKAGSATVDTDARAMGVLATKADPAVVIFRPLTAYFFVPAGTRSFVLGVASRIPEKTAKYAVISPSGRVAFERKGDHEGGEFAVTVQPEEAGKVWSLRIDPSQDATFWLDGEVCPYLSTSPERVLIEAGTKR